MPKFENKKIGLVTRAKIKGSCLNTVALEARYSIEKNLIKFSVYTNNIKNSLGEGDAYIESDHIYLHFIINHEDDHYKNIGTALIETLLTIIIANNLNQEIKLVCFNFSQGFFKNFGFTPDLTNRQKFNDPSAESLMIPATLTIRLYERFIAKKHPLLHNPCMFFFSAIKNGIENVCQKAANHLDLGQTFLAEINNSVRI